MRNCTLTTTILKINKKRISIEDISVSSQPSKKERISIFLQNKSLLWIFLALSFVIGGGSALFWKNYREKREKAAEEAIWPAESYLREESYDLALEGGRGNIGLLEIVEKYKNTKAGNLAHFYIATIYLKKKNYKETIRCLNSFDQEKSFLQPRIWCLLGGIYSDQKNYKKALSYYLKAVEHMPNEFSTPEYLLKAGFTYEKLAQYKKAEECFERIYTCFPKCAQSATAMKHASRLKVKEARH